MENLIKLKLSSGLWAVKFKVNGIKKAALMRPKTENTDLYWAGDWGLEGFEVKKKRKKQYKDTAKTLYHIQKYVYCFTIIWMYMFCPLW